VIVEGLGTITGAGQVLGSVRLPLCPHRGHVHTSARPRLLASIACLLSSIEKPHPPAHHTSIEFSGGTFILGPCGPRRLPGAHGIAPFRRQASSFANERDLPPFDAAMRSWWANSGDRKWRGVAQP